MAELTEDLLISAVKPTVFERATSYVTKLTSVDIEANRAFAIAYGTETYRVQLEWGGRHLTGSCTCLASLDGMCKHQVALGLRALRGKEYESQPVGGVENTRTEVAAFLARQNKSTLVALVNKAINVVPGMEEMIARQVEIENTGRRDSGELRDRLLKETTQVFRVRGSLDYWVAHEMGEGFVSYLNALTEYLDAGLADTIAPSFKKATERIRAISLNSDSSSGSLGMAGELAISLYARACNEGNPDPVKLAKWLVKFESGSPGWPHFELKEFAPALGDRGLEVLNRQLDSALKDRPEDFGLLEMQLAAAKLSGEVDTAARILSEKGRYAELFAMFRELGRDRDAMQALQCAIDAGAITARPNHHSDTLVAISLPEAVAALIKCGREDQVEGLTQAVFQREHSAEAYRYLLEYALDPEEARCWARTTGIEKLPPWLQANTLLTLAIDDEDWDHAFELGRGEYVHRSHRNQLALVLAANQKNKEAAEILALEVWDTLSVADSKRYPGVARQLRQIKKLYQKAGDEQSGQTLIEEVRQNYANRPSLMKRLDGIA